MPGYAVFVGGVLVDSGIIAVPTGRPLNVRLKYIADTLREKFLSPDVLVLEEIPPFRNKAAIVLFQAMGAVMAGVETREMLLVSPLTWHALADEKFGPGIYTKTDEKDAVMLGWAAFAAAGTEFDEAGIIEFLSRG